MTTPSPRLARSCISHRVARHASHQKPPRIVDRFFLNFRSCGPNLVVDRISPRFVDRAGGRTWSRKFGQRPFARSPLPVPLFHSSGGKRNLSVNCTKWTSPDIAETANYVLVLCDMRDLNLDPYYTVENLRSLQIVRLSHHLMSVRMDKIQCQHSCGRISLRCVTTASPVDIRNVRQLVLSELWPF